MYLELVNSNEIKKPFLHHYHPLSLLLSNMSIRKINCLEDKLAIREAQILGASQLSKQYIDIIFIISLWEEGFPDIHRGTNILKPFK